MNTIYEHQRRTHNNEQQHFLIERHLLLALGGDHEGMIEASQGHGHRSIRGKPGVGKHGEEEIKFRAVVSSCLANFEQQQARGFDHVVDLRREAGEMLDPEEKRC